MAIRTAFLHINIVDEAGKPRKPVPGDEVTVNGNKLTYDAKQGFVVGLTTGNADLLVKCVGFPPIQQWFESVAPAEQPRLDPYWLGSDAAPGGTSHHRKGYLLECINLTRTAGGAADARSPTIFNLTLTLAAPRDHVAVIGTDYWEGAVSRSPHAHKAHLDFLKYSLTFAKHLFAKNVLNVSSRYFVLDCQRGVIEVWRREKTRGWRAHSLLQSKQPAPDWPTQDSFRQWYDDAKNGVIDVQLYLGATNIYQFVSELGDKFPHSIVDFSVFSHSFYIGPILFNTFGNYETSAQRYVHDLDMRYPQDFSPPNVNHWSKFKDAFIVPTATINIWGCFATDFFRVELTYLRSGRTSLLSWVQTPGTPPFVRTHAEVLAELNSLFDDQSYMARIAKYVGCAVYGGPPGYGAELIKYSALKEIPDSLKKRVQGSIMFVPAFISKTSVVRKAYEGVALGHRTFNEFGYVKYSP